MIPTATRQIWVVAMNEGNSDPRFEVERVHDLDAVVIPESDFIFSALPDFAGRLWFSTRGGLGGTLDPDTGAAKTRRLEGEAVFNFFAVDETGGVFIASDHVYPFRSNLAGRRGRAATSRRSDELAGLDHRSLGRAGVSALVPIGRLGHGNE